MYEFLYRRKRIVQFILALITLPFAFFGVDYYFRSTDRTREIATVSGQAITQQEFADTMREQQERMRQIAGRNFDPSMFDDPEVRYSVLERLIDQRLLQDQARRDRLRVSDAQLAQFISEIPAFQDEGKFSHTRYEQLLASQNKTPAGFEQDRGRSLPSRRCRSRSPAPTSSPGPMSSATSGCSTSSAKWPRP
jgi:peptidyl-prolyl cis-trans isomerase D